MPPEAMPENTEDIAVDEATDGDEFEPPIDADVHDEEATEPSVSDGTGEPRE